MWNSLGPLCSAGASGRVEAQKVFLFCPANAFLNKKSLVVEIRVSLFKKEHTTCIFSQELLGL